MAILSEGITFVILIQIIFIYFIAQISNLLGFWGGSLKQLLLWKNKRFVFRVIFFKTHN